MKWGPPSARHNRSVAAVDNCIASAIHEACAMKHNAKRVDISLLQPSSSTSDLVSNAPALDNKCEIIASKICINIGACQDCWIWIHVPVWPCPELSLSYQLYLTQLTLFP